MRRIRFPRTEQRGSVRPDPLPGLVVPFCDAGAPLPRDPRRTSLPPSTIEAWPAAGGGLLLGIVAPELYGAAPLRNSIKTVFIRIDPRGVSSVIIPYVCLDGEARHCVAILLADELRLLPDAAAIDNRTVDRGLGTKLPRIIDLGTSTGRSLATLAATARSMLVSAAAETWGIVPDDCGSDDGLILEKTGARSVTYGEAASDAALLPVPAAVTLCSGERVTLRIQSATRSVIP